MTFLDGKASSSRATGRVAAPNTNSVKARLSISTSRKKSPTKSESGMDRAMSPSPPATQQKMESIARRVRTVPRKFLLFKLFCVY
jgi:hypothetical protein